MNKKEVSLVCYGEPSYRRCPNPVVGRISREAADAQPGINKGIRPLRCAEHGGAASDQCVIDAFVNYSEEFANRPTLNVLLNIEPQADEFIYSQNGPLYYAEAQGIARFHSYARPGEGYGGAMFRGKLADGTEFEHKGPWSSSAGAMNAVGFGPCIDVSIAYLNSNYKKGVDVFRDGHTFHAGAITLDLALEAVFYCVQGVGFLWVADGDLVPVKLGDHRVHGERPALREATGFDQLSAEQNAAVRIPV